MKKHNNFPIPFYPSKKDRLKARPFRCRFRRWRSIYETLNPEIKRREDFSVTFFLSDSTVPSRKSDRDRCYFLQCHRHPAKILRKTIIASERFTGWPFPRQREDWRFAAAFLLHPP